MMILRASVAWLTSLAACASAEAITYTFTLIAEASPPGSSLGDGPSINDAGAIAYTITSIGESAIVRFSPGGVATTIASAAGGSFLSFDGRPSIDRLGDTVVFRGSASGGGGVYAGSGGAVSTIMTYPGAFGALFGSPVARPGGGGAAVFVAIASGGGKGIFRGDGGQPVLLAGAPHGFTDVGNNTGVNAAGAIAFRGDHPETGIGVFYQSGTTITPLASVGPTISGLAGSIALNSNGRAAFRVVLTDNSQAMIVADTSGSTTVADTSGPYAMFRVPSMNDAGEVVFHATLDAGGSGLFRGPDPVADRIIGTGDTIDGSIVTDVAMHINALNSSGQVAFLASLSDFRQAIVRANPCVADIVANHMVDVDDLLAVVTSWGACSNCAPDITPPTGNGIVNVDDLLTVITAWGGCP